MQKYQNKFIIKSAIFFFSFPFLHAIASMGMVAGIILLLLAAFWASPVGFAVAVAIVAKRLLLIFIKTRKSPSFFLWEIRRVRFFPQFPHS